MSSVKTIIGKAKNYYFNVWRGNENICPAFGEKVYITKLGWNHIAHHPRRLLVDKLIRLKNLPLAQKVLETATTYQTLGARGNLYFYGFQAIQGAKMVKVVVTSKGKTGKKLLYSVMFKSIIRQEQRNIERHNKRIVDEFRKSHPRRKTRRKKR